MRLVHTVHGAEQLLDGAGDVSMKDAATEKKRERREVIISFLFLESFSHLRAINGCLHLRLPSSALENCCCVT